MKLVSPAFNHNDLIPSLYTCDGDDINPELQISDAPLKSASLALIVDDPDSPGTTWVHWVLFNISPTTSRIAENSVPPDSIAGLNDFGRSGWGGPCPGKGKHHYVFKLYALDTKLDLPENATKPDVVSAMQNHILDQTELICLYERT